MQIRIFFTIFCVNLVYAAQPIDDPNVLRLLHVTATKPQIIITGRVVKEYNSDKKKYQIIYEDIADGDLLTLQCTAKES